MGKDEMRESRAAHPCPCPCPCSCSCLRMPGGEGAGSPDDDAGSRLRLQRSRCACPLPCSRYRECPSRSCRGGGWSRLRLSSLSSPRIPSVKATAWTVVRTRTRRMWRMTGAVSGCFHERGLAPSRRSDAAPTLPARGRAWVRVRTRVLAWRLMPVMRSCLPPCSCSHAYPLARTWRPACVPGQTGMRACARVPSWSRRMRMGCASAADRRRLPSPCMFRRPRRMRVVRAWRAHAFPQMRGTACPPRTVMRACPCARGRLRAVPRPIERHRSRMGMMGVQGFACGQGWRRGRPCREGFPPAHGSYPYGIRSPAHHPPGGLKDPPLLYRPSSHLLMIPSARRSGSHTPPISLPLPWCASGRGERVHPRRQ